MASFVSPNSNSKTIGTNFKGKKWSCSSNPHNGLKFTILESPGKIAGRRLLCLLRTNNSYAARSASLAPINGKSSRFRISWESNLPPNPWISSLSLTCALCRLLMSSLFLPKSWISSTTWPPAKTLRRLRNKWGWPTGLRTGIKLAFLALVFTSSN